MNWFHCVMFVQMTRLILMKIKRPLSRLLDIQLCNYLVHAHWNIHHNLVLTNEKKNIGERRRSDYSSDQWLPHYITFKRYSLRIVRVCVLLNLVFRFVLFSRLVTGHFTKTISLSTLAYWIYNTALLFSLFILSLVSISQKI